MLPVSALQNRSVPFGAVRMVHFRDVTRQENFVPEQAATEASRTLSQAIQGRLGRVPVLMTRFARKADVADAQDWLLLTGPNVDTFLNDIGGVPDSEVDSDGMWHFLRGVAREAQQLPPVTVDLVPWKALEGGKKQRKKFTPAPQNNRLPKEPNATVPLKDNPFAQSAATPSFAFYNLSGVMDEIQRPVAL